MRKHVGVAVLAVDEMTAAVAAMTTTGAETDTTMTVGGIEVEGTVTTTVGMTETRADGIVVDEIVEDEIVANETATTIAEEAVMKMMTGGGVAQEAALTIVRRGRLQVVNHLTYA